MIKAIEHILELLIFNSRWLLAPFYLGLMLCILILLVKFGQELFHILPHVFSGTEGEVILAILTLVDMSLVANLLLIIVFSGYENFVSKINTDGHEDRPDWMGKVDFSGLKAKVIASIVAISAIELLKAFVNVGSELPPLQPLTAAAQQAAASIPPYSSNVQLTGYDKALAWKVIIHVVLVISGLLFAMMDRISAQSHAASEKH